MNVSGPENVPDSVSSLMKLDWLLAFQSQSPSRRNMSTVNWPPAPDGLGCSDGVYQQGALRQIGGGSTRPVIWISVLALDSSCEQPLTLYRRYSSSQMTMPSRSTADRIGGRPICRYFASSNSMNAKVTSRGKRNYRRRRRRSAQRACGLAVNLREYPRRSRRDIAAVGDVARELLNPDDLPFRIDE